MVNSRNEICYIRIGDSCFSIRLLPHHQNTGAFFVALFRKTDPSLTQEDASQKRPIEEVTFNEEG